MWLPVKTKMALKKKFHNVTENIENNGSVFRKNKITFELTLESSWYQQSLIFWTLDFLGRV